MRELLVIAGYLAMGLATTMLWIRLFPKDVLEGKGETLRLRRECGRESNVNEDTIITLFAISVLWPLAWILAIGRLCVRATVRSLAKKESTHAALKAELDAAKREIEEMLGSSR